MSDWLTYTPETFLMFSERTYRRLFEMHNAAVWPAHAAALLTGVVIMILILRRGGVAARLPLVVFLAVAWLAVAAAWFWMRFSTIHTGGRTMAVAFAIEAFALLWFGVARNRLGAARPRGVRDSIAVVLLAYGLLLHPLLGPVLGRPWSQAEVFALAPDPTAIATIGALLLAKHAHWSLWVVPIGWCLFSGLTLWAMRTPDAWVPPAIATVGVAIALVCRHERAGQSPVRQK
jgi:hypothetical protein